MQRITNDERGGGRPELDHISHRGWSAAASALTAATRSRYRLASEMCWSAHAQGDSGLAGGELLSAFTRCVLSVQWFDWDSRAAKDIH